MRDILIGGAWPYANGSLHIGHIAALLPGDVLARYHRARGDRVFYVSGSDCFGTPITIRAKQEHTTPEEISSRYHREFCEVFDALGFSYDHYGKTSDEDHIAFVQDFHRALYQGPYVEERIAPVAFCPQCGAARTERMAVGVCPYCSRPARGDQCDACGAVLEPESLLDARCAECGGPLLLSREKQLTLRLTALRPELTALLEAHPHWRKNAAAFTRRYLDEGLRDRAVTRGLDWGIDVPKAGYEAKKIYIWFENVLGYCSASKAVADARGDSFSALWGEHARHYYVHGKDNIPFHTIILPALLLAHGGNWRLPDEIISSEYMTLEGEKISTSRNWAIWAKDLTAFYQPDALRYFFLANGPEKRDTDFSWREFAERTNGELVGAYGNLVNRTLAFAAAYRGRVIPSGTPDEGLLRQAETLFFSTGQKIEAGKFKDALDGIFETARAGNRYFDAGKPWLTRDSDPSACDTVLFNCVQMIAALSVLLQPFLPFSSRQIFSWLGLDERWTPPSVPAGTVLPEIQPLFRRIDKAQVARELEKLHARQG